MVVHWQGAHNLNYMIMKANILSINGLEFCKNSSVKLGKKAALRVLQDFWSSLEEDRFEAQVLDCMAVILNYVPSLAQNFNAEYIEFCKRSEFYHKPISTAYGRQLFNACVALKLVDF